MTTPTRDLDGRVALVVGGSKHMGAAVSRELAERGADIVFSYASDGDAAASTLSELEGLGVKARAVKADATDSQATIELFDGVIDEFGRLDIVVHMPGAVLKKPLTEVTDDEFGRVQALNANTAFYTLREAGRRIADHGRIVVLSTTLTAVTTGFYAAYAAGKAAAEQMVKALSQEVGERGVTVNTVSPGPVDTPFFHGQETDESVAFFSSAPPLSRLGVPDDVAPLVGFLVSDDAQWINGQNVRVNGGFF